MKPPPWYLDGQNPWYTNGRYLPAGCGNNAFSMDRRPVRDLLTVTPLKVGSLADLTVGRHVALQEYNREEWQECVGLETAVLCLDHPVPVYVFDNHNHAFYAWCEALKMGWTERGSLLVHMDYHPDDLHPTDAHVDVTNLADVWRYTNEVLQVATFVQPAILLGLFSNRVDFVEDRDFLSAPAVGGLAAVSRGVVINLDLDVFRDALDQAEIDRKVDLLRAYIPQARLITMATSPYFIRQELAVRLAGSVIKDLFSQGTRR